MANLKDHENRLELYRRADKKWAWRLIVNHNVVATDGSQGYENATDAQSMASRIISGEFATVTTWRIGD